MNRLSVILMAASVVVAGTVARGQAPEVAAPAARSPAVEAVMALSRETPTDRVRALLALVDLNERELAAEELKALVEANPTDEEKASLAIECGTARILQIAKLEPMAAGARDFATSCLAAANRRLRDPARLSALVAKLSSDSAFERQTAIADLATTGQPGVAACLQALAQAEDEDTRAHLMAALVALAPATKGPLLAVLDGAEGRLLRDAAELAGHLRVGEAVPALSAALEDEGAGPTAAAALERLGIAAGVGSTALLQKQLDQQVRLLGGSAAADAAPEAADEQLLTWWTWDGRTSVFTEHTVNVEQYRVLLAARVARLLLANPGVEEGDEPVAVALCLAEADILKGPVAPVAEEKIAAFSGAQLGLALKAAIELNLVASAEKLAALIADRGDEEAVLSDGLGLAPLVEGVCSGNRRVRWACLTAVMEVAPEKRFAGASNVPKALEGFIRDALDGKQPGEEGVAQARQSLEWLASLLEPKAPYDELPRYAAVAEETLYTPELAKASLDVLAATGSAGSQKALVDYAGSPASGGAEKAAAVEAFAASVERFGKRLTGTDILRIYRQYNASGGTENQKPLAQILDILEKP